MEDLAVSKVIMANLAAFKETLGHLIEPTMPDLMEDPVGFENQLMHRYFNRGRAGEVAMAKLIAVKALVLNLVAGKKKASNLVETMNHVPMIHVPTKDTTLIVGIENQRIAAKARVLNLFAGKKKASNLVETMNHVPTEDTALIVGFENQPMQRYFDRAVYVSKQILIGIDVIHDSVKKVRETLNLIYEMVFPRAIEPSALEPPRTTAGGTTMDQIVLKESFNFNVVINSSDTPDLFSGIEIYLPGCEVRDFVGSVVSVKIGAEGRQDEFICNIGLGETVQDTYKDKLFQWYKTNTGYVLSSNHNKFFSEYLRYISRKIDDEYQTVTA